jgi:hypothetical protein
MENIICIRHPQYKGTDSPTLSCKTCCSIFLAEIKAKQEQSPTGTLSTQEWLATKMDEARRAVIAQPSRNEPHRHR